MEDKLKNTNKNIKYCYTWVPQADIVKPFSSVSPDNFIYSPYFVTNVEGELLKWGLSLECYSQYIKLWLHSYSANSTERLISFTIQITDNKDEIKGTIYHRYNYNDHLYHGDGENQEKFTCYSYEINRENFGIPDDAYNFTEHLKEMTITVECNIYFEVAFCTFKGNVNPLSLPSTNHCLEELNNLEEFFNSGKMSDMKIIAAGGQEFHVHKLILSLRSKAFLDIITRDMQETSKNVLEIGDVDSNVVREMLRFVYTERVENIDDIVVDLLKVADRYDLQGLKDLCETKLIERVNLENFRVIFDSAGTFRAEKLKKHMLEFLFKQLQECRQIKTNSD